jgi:hypothetical protein
MAVVSLLGSSFIGRRPAGIRFTGLSDGAPFVMRVVVSLVVLAAGLYIILNQSYTVEDKKWGYGIVGTVVGYWLKG